jgi:hypothetical protein
MQSKQLSRKTISLTKMKICTGSEGGRKKDTRKAKNALQGSRESIIVPNVGK